jgi:hypothetical protein
MSWKTLFQTAQAALVCAALGISALALGQDSDTEARLQEYREKVLVIMNRYAEWGGPRSIQVKGISAEEAADHKRLRRIASELGDVDSNRFKPGSMSFENLAILFNQQNPALSQVFRTTRGSHAFRHRVKDWLGRHAQNLRPEIETERLKVDVLKILAAYPPAGPASNSSGQTLLDFSRLGDISLTLGRLDPERYQVETSGFSNLAILLENDHPDLAHAIRERVEARNIPEKTLAKRQELQTKLKGLSFAEQREETLRAFQEEIIRIYKAYPKSGGPYLLSRNPDPELAAVERADAKKLVVMGARLKELSPSRFDGKTGKENLARLVENLPEEGAELAALIRTIKGSRDFKIRLRLWRQARHLRKMLECLSETP